MSSFGSTTRSVWSPAVASVGNPPPKEEYAVPHPFLTDDWLAEVKAIRDRYAGKGTPIGYKVKMNQVITGVPFDDGEMRLFMDTSNGEIVLEKGSLDDADLTITTDYETARKIFVDQDPQAAMQAFMAGKIKVQGDMMKLIQMQATPPDDTARAAAAEIKAATS
jgi:putative sterol carrier protein